MLITDVSVQPLIPSLPRHQDQERSLPSDMATRILHHYIDMRIRPFLEQRLGEHSFNNRVGLGTNACQNAVISDIYEVSKGFTQDAWIVKLDMSGCFPNIRQDVAYRQLEEVILTDYDGEDKDDLIYILQVCVYSYPTHHCYRKSSIDKWKDIKPEKSLFTKPDGIGAAIGHLIWQNAVNYYFSDLDHWILSMGVKYERYVDDMYFVTDNKTAFLTYMIPEVRQRLKAVGARLNERKFYCQHYTKGCECLGIHIKMDRIYPNRRVIRRGMNKARNFNRCIRESKVGALIASMNSYLGICKNANGYNQAMKILGCLSKRWFEFVEFDSHRVCLVAKEGYKYNQRIIRQFNLK